MFKGSYLFIVYFKEIARKFRSTVSLFRISKINKFVDVLGAVMKLPSASVRLSVSLFA
jgi:hypothetical protein